MSALRHDKLQLRFFEKRLKKGNWATRQKSQLSPVFRGVAALGGRGRDRVFIQKDPIGFEGGINLYSYTLNNPINLTDPSGLESAGYGGWEVQFIAGYGEVTVTCCDDEKLRKLKYRKVCLGAGFTAGISSGIAGGSQGQSCKNPPKYVLGGELGFPLCGALGAEGGAGVGTSGGIGTFGGGTAGVGGKATACFYWLVSNTEKGCCNQ